MTINIKETVTAAIAAGAATAAADPSSNVENADVPKVIAAAQAAAAPAVQEAQSRFDYATNNETFFKSWGNNAGIGSTVAGIYGMVIALHDGFQPVEDQTLMLTGIVSLVSGIGWFIGRWRGKPIGE